jgi:hypothetical protein
MERGSCSDLRAAELEQRAAKRARAKLHGEGVDEGRQVHQVHDTVER